MRIIIVGCGGMGTYQAKKFQQLGATIVGAIDHNPTNLDTFCTLYAVPWRSFSLDDLALMQGKAEAVSCALPDRYHLSCCMTVLAMGFALFAEKPMGSTLSDARSIVEASHAVLMPSMVNYSKRNMQALHSLRTVVLEDTLGKLLSVTIQYNQGWVLTNAWGDWRAEPRWKWRLLPTAGNGGCIGDLASHLVDALFFLFDSVTFMRTTSFSTLGELVSDGTIPLCDEYRQTFLRNGSVPVAYEGFLQVGAGIPCHLSCTQVSPSDGDTVRISVVGSRGQATLDSSHSRNSVMVTSDTGSCVVEGPPTVTSTYASFMNWVDNSVPARPTLSDGLLVQEILEEMKQCRLS
jgi:predicted dehydrogenase